MLRRWVMTMVLFSGVMMAGGFLDARQADDAQRAFEAARRMEVVDRDLRGAMEKYRDVVSRYSSNRPVVANTLVRLATIYQELGQPEATATFQRVVRDFADQPTAVAAAKAGLSTARPTVTAQTGVVRRVIYEDAEWLANAVSPDGRYATGRPAGTRPLTLRTLPAKDDRLLFPQTETSVIAGPPVFSPNGAQAAFVWVELQGEVRLSSIGVIGTSPNAVPKRVTPGVAGNINRISPVAWSADGSTVIVRTSEFAAPGQMTASTLDWVSVDSGETTRSIPFSTQNDLPVMSPSGDYFAYEKIITPQTEPVTESRIYTIDSYGRNETEVVRIAGRHRSPVWTPDGSAILFLSDRTGRDGLWAVMLQNGQALGEPVLIQDSLGPGVELVGVAADGTVYLRETQRAQQHVFLAERGVPGARGLRAYVGGGASWSPDGASVAFLKSEGSGEGNSLIIKNVTTGDERQFDHPNGLGPSHIQVRWSRDGASILVTSQDRRSLSIFDLQSGQFRQVPGAEGRVRAFIGDISPDGRTIYVASGPTGADSTRVPFTELVAVDVATGAERTLVDLADLGHYFRFRTGPPPGIAVSPDGQYVVLQVGEANPPVVMVRLVLVATDGSGSRVLTEPYRMDNVFGTIAWAPDGQSILYFTGSQQQATWRLMRVPAGGGEPIFDGLERETLVNDSSLPVLAPFPPWSLTVSPDGSRVAFGIDAGRSSQLVALDNVLAAIAVAR